MRGNQLGDRPIKNTSTEGSTVERKILNGGCVKIKQNITASVAKTFYSL
jgi:hypothetical protein